MIRKSDDNRAAEAARLYASGKTSREIAPLLGVDNTTIIRWLVGATRRTGPRGRLDVPTDLIISLRDRDKLSWGEIATQVGMSRTGVRKRYVSATAPEA